MKRKCKQCELNMFRFEIIHNGKKKVVWKCVNPHGITDNFGKKGTKLRRLNGKERKLTKGVKKIFSSIFSNRFDKTSFEPS